MRTRVVSFGAMTAKTTLAKISNVSDHWAMLKGNAVAHWLKT
jgi:hypothetical protein